MCVCSDLGDTLTNSHRCRHTSLNISGLTNVGVRNSISGEAATALQRDPGLRWKISYLGVWPSHQIELRRALKLVYHAWYLGMPHIINSAILSCHKNLLWYRLFDDQYFPASPSSTQSSEEEDPVEIGEEADVILTSEETTHRGLTCEEFQDLANSAPLKVDLLRMDPRLVDLLNMSRRHLLSPSRSVVNHLNACCGRVVAFIFKEAITETSGWTHLVLIDPSYREGLIHVSWRLDCSSSHPQIPAVRRSSIEQGVVSRSSISRFSSILRNVLSPGKPPLEGIPVVESPTDLDVSSTFCVSSTSVSYCMSDLR